MGNAKEALKELLSEMEGFVSTKTVVGEAIHMDDIIILPLVDVSLGAGAGALTRALSAAPMHIGHGSNVTYRSHSGSRQLPNFLQARSMAYISACEMAVCVLVRRL